MTNLTAPAAIRGRLVGRGADITARTIARREWVAANAHHGQAAIAAALGLSRDTIRNQYHALFAALSVARIERPAKDGPAKDGPAKDVTAVVYERHMASSSSQTAPRVNLPRMPWDDAERGPDARHETAPRRRVLIGARVERNEPVDHTDRILSALMNADTLRDGKVS